MTTLKMPMTALKSQSLHCSKKTMMNETNRRGNKSLKRSRRVHFERSETDTRDCEGAGPLFQTLDEQTCSEIWYNPVEIGQFKKEARKIILQSPEDEDKLCGLERFNYERSMGKKSVLRLVLRAQKEDKRPEFIRQVYEKCASWATEYALEQGFVDFCRVYDPLQSLLGTASENYNDCFFNQLKRKAEPACSWDEEERRVRPRLSSNCSTAA